MVAAKSLVAAQEREKISERVKAGMAAAKAKGKKMGRKPGHSSNRGWRKSYPPELVEKIKVMSGKGMSVREIAKILGGENQKLSPSTVHSIKRRCC